MLLGPAGISPRYRLFSQARESGSRSWRTQRHGYAMLNPRWALVPFCIAVGCGGDDRDFGSKTSMGGAAGATDAGAAGAGAAGAGATGERAAGDAGRDAAAGASGEGGSAGAVANGEGGDSSAGDGSTGESGAAGTTGGGEPVAQPFACDDPLPLITFPVVLTSDAAPPKPAGGKLVDGVYVLDRVEIYGTYYSVPADAFELRGGYLIHEYVAYSKSGSALTGYKEIGTYATTGAVMAVSGTVCSIGTSSLWRFTAEGEKIQLFDTEASTTWVQTFHRQR